jgi:hypothetical protein
VRNVEITNPQHRSVSDRRGVILSLAMDRLAGNTSNVLIQAVTSRAGRTEIEFKSPNSIRVAADLGILSDAQDAYIATSTTGGTLIINDADLSIVEFRAAEVVERYSDYQKIGDSGIAPKNVSLDFARTSGQPFLFEFRIHEPGLWLFESGQRKQGEKILSARVRNVRVNSDIKAE